MTWSPPDLSTDVAIVTGATRGVGKGVAVALGDCGATVYVTGRSTRANAGPRPGTVEETAEAVTARGGRGIAVPTDHTDDDAVEALFARVGDEHGALDILVANAWGGYERNADADFTAPFWEQPVWRWDAMFTAGLRAQFTAARLATPLMLGRDRALIACTGFASQTHYLGNVPYDVVKASVDRLVTAMAFELRPHGAAAVGVYPGFTRTEAVVAAFAEGGEEPPPETHSPEFVGRGVAMLHADDDVLAVSGKGIQAAELARRYGFTDVDGREIEPFRMPDTLRL
jgi:NAD(P)-dependent dehydrogenase (short-subunit alcohol dehydrogenase family)